DPFDELAHHQRIEALVRSGRASAAVLAYEALAELLRSELGIAPSAETTALLASVGPAPTPEVAIGRAATGTVPVVPAARARRRAWDLGAGRFVGRSAELDALGSAWTDVVEHGRPQVVVIDGHAGLGKSRLAA